MEINIKEKIHGRRLNEEEEYKILWDSQHNRGAEALHDVIEELKGFYVKAAQIISSRRDLFPSQYTEKLNGFTDDLEPMSTSLAKAVIKQELLTTESFEDVFVEFDDMPLGSASIGQVHRAVLSEKYGGKEVAIKIQRPSIESKLMGDIANLKAYSKMLRDSLPIDYYSIFVELEKQLRDEFDFTKEADAMYRIYNSLTRSFDGSKSTKVPLIIPRPIPGLVSKRVVTMDYLKGFPLSRAADEMKKRGIDVGSPESKLFAHKLLRSLTYVFGRSLLETGFIHGDPHPGNIFVLENGEIGLIDFGQVKQISNKDRLTLAKVMVALTNMRSRDDYVDDEYREQLNNLGDLAKDLGFEFRKDAKPEAASATMMWMFDGSESILPGGYDKGELSPNSPIKALKTFPQDLVLVARSSVLIKALSSRNNIPWNLSKEWAPIAEMVLNPSQSENKKENIIETITTAKLSKAFAKFKVWGKSKTGRAMQRLPCPFRKKIMSIVTRIQYH
jgi:aarF domain-containing kinase